jgi:tyrosine-protein phosphatase SIW14
MSLRKTIAIAVGIPLLIALAVGGWYFSQHYDERNYFFNFGVVVPGKLFRSGQLKPKNFEELAEKHGIKSIICLRGKEDSDVYALAKERGVKILGVELTAKRPPKPEQLELIMKALSGASFKPSDYSGQIRQGLGLEGDTVRLEPPYVIHCAAGADRTGYIVAVYRICFEGWSTEKARMEMLRYFHLPAQYPALWASLKQIEPDKFCPALNPDFKTAAPAKIQEGEKIEQPNH